MSLSPDERLAAARAAVAHLVDAVAGEGRRGAFWLPRLQQVQQSLAAADRPADQVLADAATLEDLLYAAPRDNFADFYLVNVDSARRAEANRRFTAAAQSLHAALTRPAPDRG
jgi:hypothetical protein